MAADRKSVIFTGADGRDVGKKYLITEKSAYDGEMWAMRAFCALANGNVFVPENLKGMGLVGALRMLMGALERLPFAEAKVLLDDMFTCVSFLPDTSKRDAEGEYVTRPLVDTDIQEIPTRIKLRKAIFSLHADFILAVFASTPAPAEAAPTSGG